MKTIFIQWKDADKQEILSVFGCPQDPATYPNQDDIPSDDLRYAEYYLALPPIMQAGLPEPGS